MAQFRNNEKKAIGWRVPRDKEGRNGRESGMTMRENNDKDVCRIDANFHRTPSYPKFAEQAYIHTDIHIEIFTSIYRWTHSCRTNGRNPFDLKWSTLDLFGSVQIEESKTLGKLLATMENQGKRPSLALLHIEMQTITLNPSSNSHTHIYTILSPLNVDLIE